MWQDLAASLGALIPSVGVLALFVVVVRALILADRRERLKRSQEDAQLRGVSGTERHETNS